MKRFLFPALLVLASCISGTAQTATTYRVLLGTFVDARMENFQSLRQLGFIYAIPQSNNYKAVYLGGGIPSYESARSLANQARSLGYRNAQPQAEPTSNVTAYTVQLASISRTSNIDWEKHISSGNLYFMVQDKSVKLTYGNYSNPAEASNIADQVKASGKAGAFVKPVDPAKLNRVGTFELDGVKADLIPLNVQDPAPSSYGQTGNRSRGTQNAFGMGGNSSYYSSPTVGSTPPDIRSDIKRNSVYELQKVLKANGAYTGSLDGYYGAATQTAFDQFVQQFRDLQKYRILASSLDYNIETGPDDELQAAINNLRSDGYNSVSTMERYSIPIAFAYRAYYLLVTQGPSNQVNSLMQEALQRAYAGKAVTTRLPFEMNMTYSYQSLTQLLNHIQYVHSAPDNKYVVPCWLYTEHPTEVQQARVGFFDYANDQYALESCDEFTDWELIRVMIAVSEDLGGRHAKDDPVSMVRNASRRTKLYFITGPLQNREIPQQAEAWIKALMSGLDRWAGNDPMHQNMLITFRVGFYKSMIHLEDFFMKKGYDARESRTLAIVTLHTLVSYQLERFYNG